MTVVPNRLIYLGTPYSHADPAIRYDRFRAAERITAGLVAQGHIVFSPIAYLHTMVHKFNLPNEPQFYLDMNYRFLRACDAAWFVLSDGYTDCEYMCHEMAYCEQHNIEWDPVEHNKMGRLRMLAKIPLGADSEVEAMDEPGCPSHVS